MKMNVQIERVNDNVLLKAENESGNTIHLDGSEKVGGVNGGFRPMQLLLAGIGGCSAIDVISILKKQRQEIKGVRISVDGEREDGKTPSPFTAIHLHYELIGTFDTAKAERAVQLGVEKYCSVGVMLEKTARITYDLEILDA